MASRQPVEVVVGSHRLSTGDIEAMASLHTECFGAMLEDGAEGPGVAGHTTRCEAWIQRVTSCCNADEAVWFLLRSPHIGALEGMATAVPYYHSKSVYLFNLCVSPRARARGLGSRLVWEVAAYAVERGLPTVCGTVDSADVRLVGYYEKLGGERVVTGHGGGAAVEPPTVRYARTTSASEVQSRLSTLP